MKNRFDLTGKVALVTGGSRGLGRAMALGFAENGADVIIASRKFDACEAVAAEVRALGRRALPIAANVSRWDDCDALVHASYAAFGKIDVLVNNAGLSPLYGKLSEVTEELFDKIVALTGHAHQAAHALEQVVVAGAGRPGAVLPEAGH